MAASPPRLKGEPVLHLSRSVLWLGGIALLAWGCAAALVGFQMAGDVPAPCGGFVGLIATTLTIVAVQLAKRESPAKAYRPAPLDVVLPSMPPPSDDPTIGISMRVRATVPLYPLPMVAPQPAGRTYRSVPLPAPSPVPRPRTTIESAVTTEGRVRHGQDYWDAVSDVAETLFERRDDDPPAPA